MIELEKIAYIKKYSKTSNIKWHQYNNNTSKYNAIEEFKRTRKYSLYALISSTISY